METLPGDDDEEEDGGITVKMGVGKELFFLLEMSFSMCHTCFHVSVTVKTIRHRLTVQQPQKQ